MISRYKRWMCQPHLCFLVASTLAVPVLAQSKAPQNVGMSKGQYTLGADDVISVTVLRHPELSVEQITVPSSGQIDLPEAGTIRVVGRTTNGVAQEISRVLGETMIAPQVTVSLKQGRARRLFVLGAVARPGVYDIKPNWRITEALAAAGGLPGRTDETTATLARAGQNPITIDLTAALGNPASSANRTVLAGDVLSLQAAEPQRVTVSGDVLKPDLYPLRRAPRLLDALNAAGGLRQRASETRGFLLRGGKRLPLDLADAVEFRVPTANIALQSGDLITVENIPPLQVTVTGPFIKNAGNFQLSPQAGVVQAIAQAGGLTVPPEQVVASVRRGMQVLPVDLTRAALDPRADVPLETGDAVLVNEPTIIRVQVTGTVNRPGELRLPPGTPVLEAVARAGGLGIKPEAARISILRSSPTSTDPGGDTSQNTLGVDATALYTRNDLSQNVPLRDGDLVSVTQIQSSVVTISGEVARPGPYEIQPGESLPELIARAGGQTGDAALTRVVLKRNTNSQPVDVYNAVTTGGKSDVVLQSGDFVVVPRNDNHVVVMQAVVRPGNYTIPENRNLTVTDALSLAGGPRDRGAIKEVALLRPDPRAENGVQRRIISLDKIYKGDLSENVKLQSGDVLYVPGAKAQGSLLGSLGQVVGTLTGLRYLGGF